MPKSETPNQCNLAGASMENLSRRQNFKSLAPQRQLSTDATEEFRAAMMDAGITPPADIFADGRIHRFHNEGDRPSSKNGWYVFFTDPPAGSFGSWKDGISETWSAREYQSLTREEKAAYKANMEAAKAERERLQAEIHAECRERAAAIWSKAEPAQEDHPYLIKKGVLPHDAKDYKGALLLPVMGNDGTLHGLQFIDPGGDKRFLSGTQKKGHFSILGEVDKVLHVAEGFATAATIYEATGLPCAVAFDAGNLKPVCEGLRLKYPNTRLVVCADNDENGKGEMAAREAAEATGAAVVTPPKDAAGTDFNDLYMERGLEAVRDAIAAGSEEKARVQLIRASDIVPKPISWIWRDWLAAGKLHIIAGAPGTGKSTLAFDFAATITTGGRWPDGDQARKAEVVIWSGEDDPEDTIVPRLIACGADLDAVHILGGMADPEPRHFDPSQDMDALRHTLKGRNVRLLIVDPVVSAVAADSHKNTEVRRALQPLVDLAQETGCAVLGISHFSKGTAGRDPVERVTGSLAFGALPRVVMATAKLPEEEHQGARLLARAKSNIGPDNGGFHYHPENIELPSIPGIFNTRIRWGKAVDGAARDLLAEAEKDNDGSHSATDEAMEWLRDLLLSGPVKASEATKEARATGIGDKPLRNAREKLKIKPQKRGFPGAWWWSLEDALPEDAPKMPIQHGMAPSEERELQYVDNISVLRRCPEDAQGKSKMPFPPEDAQFLKRAPSGHLHSDEVIEEF